MTASRFLTGIVGEEKTDSAVVRAYFANQATSTIYSESGVIADDITLTTRSYIGRIELVDGDKLTWNTLTSSYEQRIFRFQLYVTYNRWNNGVFQKTKIKWPLTTDAEWTLGIRFVSKV